MKNPKVLLLEVFLISFIVIASSCVGGIDLFVNVEEGDSYKYDVTRISSFEVEMGNHPISISQETDTTYLVNIKDIDDNGIITADYLLDSIKGKTETPVATFNFDSTTTDENDPMSKIYSKIIGMGRTIKMASNGEIIEVSRQSNMIESMIDSEGVDTEALNKSLEENLGDEAIKSIFEQTTTVFPDEIIKPGYTWEQNISVKNKVEFNMNIKYTLDKIENGIAYISMDSEYSADASKLIKESGIDAPGGLSGTLTGNIEVNTGNAFISTGSLDLNMSGSFELGDFSIPMSFTSEISYTTTEQ